MLANYDQLTPPFDIPFKSASQLQSSQQHQPAWTAYDHNSPPLTIVNQGIHHYDIVIVNVELTRIIHWLIMKTDCNQLASPLLFKLVLILMYYLYTYYISTSGWHGATACTVPKASFGCEICPEVHPCGRHGPMSGFCWTRLLAPVSVKQGS